MCCVPQQKDVSDRLIIQSSYCRGQRQENWPAGREVGNRSDDAASWCTYRKGHELYWLDKTGDCSVIIPIIANA